MNIKHYLEKLILPIIFIYSVNQNQIFYQIYSFDLKEHKKLT
jgi:hypothetical protein